MFNIIFVNVTYVYCYFFIFFCFFFNDTATTEIYTLSLHDALPISAERCAARGGGTAATPPRHRRDRKSTRLNSSHRTISYALFCLKKKKKTNQCTRSTKNTSKTKTRNSAATYE